MPKSEAGKPPRRFSAVCYSKEKQKTARKKLLGKANVIRVMWGLPNALHKAERWTNSAHETLCFLAGDDTKGETSHGT